MWWIFLSLQNNCNFNTTCTELVFVVLFEDFKGTSHAECYAACRTAQDFTLSQLLIL